MTFHQKELLFEVAQRLRGEAIRHEHETAEALIRKSWISVVRHTRKARNLHDQADAVAAAHRSRE